MSSNKTKLIFLFQQIVYVWDPDFDVDTDELK